MNNLYKFWKKLITIFKGEKLRICIMKQEKINRLELL